MNWTSVDTWITLTAIACAAACALPGSFLVLRKMSMMGDAISHAVLPGIALGFLLTGSRASMGMFVGAAVVGVLTAVFTQWVGRFGRVDRGAAMGIVFTTLFAVGLLMIVRAADHVDLDPSCVLYGAIEYVPLDTVAVMQREVPRAFLVLGCVMLLNLAAILVFFKELRLSAFDPALADALGFRAEVMHYLLMVMTAVTTVASFEAVGSIMVIAMLIVPAATARLLTNRLSTMLVVAVLLGAMAAVLGHLGAMVIPGWIGFESTSSSGMMAVMTGVIFFLAWVFYLTVKNPTKARAGGVDG